ncbi:hypothetical protein LTR85_011479 [Meristemomyces frigidus]|nr:hypothetical protein LTR85_011479 [Meristemomyces frigidus]
MSYNIGEQHFGTMEVPSTPPATRNSSGTTAVSRHQPHDMADTAQQQPLRESKRVAEHSPTGIDDVPQQPPIAIYPSQQQPDDFIPDQDVGAHASLNDLTATVHSESQRPTTTWASSVDGGDIGPSGPRGDPSEPSANNRCHLTDSPAEIRNAIWSWYIDGEK